MMYIKPKVPAKFAIRYESGVEDGPFFAENLVVTDFEGEPWVLATLGSPRLLAVTKQEGNTLYTDDGKIELVPLEN